MYTVHTQTADHGVPLNQVFFIRPHEVILDFLSKEIPLQCIREGIVSFTYEDGTTVPVKRGRASGTKLSLDV